MPWQVSRDRRTAGRCIPFQNSICFALRSLQSLMVRSRKFVDSSERSLVRFAHNRQNGAGYVHRADQTGRQLPLHLLRRQFFKNPA